MQSNILADVPALPTEIWQNILRWATCVPFALNTDLPDHFAYPPHPTQDQIQEQLAHVLPTKAILTRVCRYWNAIVTPFLYEAVLVRDDRTCIALCKTLQSSTKAIHHHHDRQQTDHLGVTPLGSRVKRFDIMLNEMVASKHGLDGTFELLPNLEILVSRGKGIARDNYFPMTFLCPPNTAIGELRIFDASQFVVWGQVERLMGMIEHNPNLKQLRCRTLCTLDDCCPKEDNQPLQIQLWDMTSRSLKVNDSKIVTLYSSMHSLRYLVCNRFLIRPELSEALPVIGPRLETLVLDMYRDHFTQDHFVRKFLSDVARLCPLLRSILLNIFGLDGLTLRGLTHFPPVTNVGLFFSETRFRCKRKEINGLLSGLSNVIQRFDTVKIIRILDQRTTDYLLRDHLPSLKRFRGSLPEMVRFEGSNGQSIPRPV